MGSDEPISAGARSARILFVDDEPLVLRSLKRATRVTGKAWEAHFVENGPEALEYLEREPVDVIVSDMHMPIMDGATLLTKVQERHPDVVRIVLSGHADPRLAFRAVPVAHQFLTKPFDTKHLVTTLDRAVELRALIGNAELRAVVGKDNKLPSAPRTYTALTRLLARDDVAMRDIVAVIERDPALCARVAQLASSGFFRVPRSIRTISGYLSYLGVDVLKTLVLSVELATTFGTGGVVPAGFSIESVERHSLAVGNLARKIVTRRDHAEEAFVAGLLHDVGRLVLASRRPQDFAKVLRESTRREISVQAAELEVFGTTHAEVGGYLLGIWGLPLEIVNAVSSHHTPSRLARDSVDVSAAVYLANVLSHDPDAPVTSGGDGTDGLDGDLLERLNETSNLELWRHSAHEILDGAAQAASGA
jgi:putative nucleotidyltransferase with HDIG domain